MSGARIRGVIPLAFLVLGLAALGAGAAVLRTFGPRYRVGRLLATTPNVTIADARRLAGGPERYVQVRGRVDAEEPFEDENHRPLVFRRTRLERRDGRAWAAFEDERQSVPFEVREGLDGIGIDSDALDVGLIVVNRESTGSAADLGDRAPAGIPPETGVRIRIEQVSAVEHAIVVGVPRALPDGSVHMTGGLGRPLILTTLEPPEAIRLLAEGRTRTPLAAAMFLGAGLIFVTVGFAWAIVEAVL